MNTLPERLKRALEFEKISAADASVDTTHIVPTPIRGWGPSEGSWFVDGARWENVRLAPIHERLIAITEEIESAIHNQEADEDCDPCGNNKAIFENLTEAFTALSEVLSAKGEEK